MNGRSLLGVSRASSRWWGQVLALGAVGLLMVGALAWRLVWMDLPYTSDEIGNLTTTSRWRLVVGAEESAVNPPLLRLLNLWGAPWDTLESGRWLSLVCSVLAVAAAYGAGRAAAGRPAIGLYLGVASAALVAMHPWMIRYGTLFRAYAPWSLTVLTMLWALGRTRKEDGRIARGWVLLAACLAAVLPWWHYLGVAALGGMALALGVSRATRGLALVPGAGLLSILPMVPAITGPSARRVAPGEPFEETLRKLTSTGLQPPGWFREVLWDPVGRMTNVYPPLGDIMGGVFVGAACLALWRWRVMTPVARAAWGGLFGLAGAVLVVGRVQFVRPSTIVMVVSLLAPALAGVCASPRRPGARLLLAAWVTAWIGPSVPVAVEALRARVEDDRGLEEVLRRYEGWSVEGWPIVVHPSRMVHSVYVHLARRHPRTSPKGPGCEGWRPCMTHEGQTWAGVEEAGDGSRIHGVLVSLDRYRPAGMASACVPIDEGRAWRAWACGNAVAALGLDEARGAGVHPPPRVAPQTMRPQ